MDTVGHWYHLEICVIFLSNTGTFAVCCWYMWILIINVINLNVRWCCNTNVNIELKWMFSVSACRILFAGFLKMFGELHNQPVTTFHWCAITLRLTDIYVVTLTLWLGQFFVYVCLMFMRKRWTLCVFCRLLVGAPWSGFSRNRKGDVYKCPVSGSKNSCDKLNLQGKVSTKHWPSVTNAETELQMCPASKYPKCHQNTLLIYDIDTKINNVSQLSIDFYWLYNAQS